MGLLLSILHLKNNLKKTCHFLLSYKHMNGDNTPNHNIPQCVVLDGCFAMRSHNNAGPSLMEPHHKDLFFHDEKEVQPYVEGYVTTELEPGVSKIIVS